MIWLSAPLPVIVVVAIFAGLACWIAGCMHERRRAGAAIGEVLSAVASGEALLVNDTGEFQLWDAR